MKRKLVVTAEAREDTIEQYKYFAEQSPDLADRFWSAAYSTFQKLARQPMGERLRPRNIALKGLKLWHVHGFDNQLIFYVASRNAVEIIRVLHAARDWMTILRKQFER
jgi:toxin ParE1/3/4